MERRSKPDAEYTGRPIGEEGFCPTEFDVSDKRSQAEKGMDVEAIPPSALPPGVRTASANDWFV